MNIKVKFIQMIVSMFLFSMITAGCNTTKIPVSPTTTLTPESTQTVIARATSTLSPTPTPTPTLTPTPKLPVGIGTPFPHPSVKISTETVGEIRELARYGTGKIFETNLTADGRLLFVATTGGVIIYDVQTNSPLSQIDVIARGFSGQGNVVGLYSSLESSADGHRWMVVTRDGVEIRQLDGTLVLQIPKSEFPDQTSVDLSPDGSIAAISNCSEWGFNCQIQVWNVSSGNVVFEHSGKLPVFSPDGALMAADVDKTTEIWQISDWTDVGIPSSQGQKYFSPDGTLLAIGLKSQVLIWNVPEKRFIRYINLAEPGFILPRVQFSPNSQIVAILNYPTTSAKFIITIWNIADGKLLNSQEVQSWDTIFRLSDTGEIALYETPTLESESVKLPDYPSNFSFIEQNQTLFIEGQSWTDLGKRIYLVCQISLSANAACSQSEQALTSNLNGQVYVGIMNTSGDTLEIRRGINGDGAALTTVHVTQDIVLNTVSPNEDFLFFSTGLFGRPPWKLNAWDIPNNTLFGNWSGDWVGVEFTSDGNLGLFELEQISGHSVIGEILEVVDLENHKILFQKQFSGSDNYSTASITRDGRELVYVTEKCCLDDKATYIFHVIDVDSGKTIASFNYELPSTLRSYITKSKFSPDGKLLAVGFSTGEIMLVDVSTGSVVHIWNAHQGDINALDFSSDSTMIASMSADGFTKIWGIWP